MTGMLKISEGTALALHALAYLTISKGQTVSARELAEVIKASEAHMIKICQTMCKADLLASKRGPQGGFYLKCKPAKVTLEDVYTLFNGKMDKGKCLFAVKGCDDQNMQQCLFGDKLMDINRQIIQYFRDTTIADISANCHKVLTDKQ